MTSMFGRIILSCISIGVATAGMAQGPPVFTDTPIMLGLAGKAVRAFVQHHSSDAGKATSYVLAMPYNLTARTQMGVVAPFVRKRLDGDVSGSGPGDISVFAKQQIVQNDGQGKTFRALAKVSQAFPTGRTGGTVPIGSGQWRTGVGIVAGYITTDIGIYAELGHIFRSGIADRNYYALAVSKPLLPQVYPPRQLNISVDLIGQTGSGGFHTMLIAPGLQWIAGRKVLFEAGPAFPVIEKLVPPAQKSELAFRMGTRILLF